MHNSALPDDPEFSRVLRDAWIWLDDHTLRIVLALAAGGVIVAILWGAKLMGRKLAKGGHAWWSVIGRALTTMRMWFMAVAAAQIVSLYAHPPEDIAKTIGFLFTIAATFQAAIFARELILGAVEVRAGEADPQGGLSSAIGLIRLAITATLFIIAIVLILSNLGVNVTGLVAGLGVGGIAIGLAAKGVFEDLFAALSILFDKPFRRGDFIRWEKGSGRVEAIGLKSTRLRAVTGEEVIVSNTNLLSKELLNVTLSERRRITQPLCLAYQTRPETCARLPKILRELVDAVEDCHFLRCSLDSFGTSSLDFVLTYDIGSHDVDVISDRKHSINIAILERFAKDGIGFAHPVQVAFTAAPDGRLIMPYPES